jgi:hypothetical protein
LAILKICELRALGLKVEEIEEKIAVLGFKYKRSAIYKILQEANMSTN